jgi:hypothetical protein
MRISLIFFLAPGIPSFARLDAVASTNSFPGKAPIETRN